MIKSIKNLLKEIKKNKGALISLYLISFFIIVAIFAPLLAPTDPIKVYEGKASLPLSFLKGGESFFILGTDDLGRDLLSRLIYGSRISILVGLLVVIFSGFLGTILGAISGYYEGLIDKCIMRLTDLIMSIPSLLFGIVIVAILGPSLINTIWAITIVTLPNFIRIVRSQYLMEKNKQYVDALKLYGASDFKIIFIEIFPNTTAPLIVQSTLALSDGILNCAALGFLGMGVVPPTPEWGVMLSDAKSFIDTNPILVTLPGLMIFILVIAFNLLGDGLRDALDPKLKKDRE